MAWSVWRNILPVHSLLSTIVKPMWEGTVLNERSAKVAVDFGPLRRQVFLDYAVIWSTQMASL